MSQEDGKVTVSIRQLHSHFVGEVEGIDLRQPLATADVDAINEGMDRYAVLIFHDQNITDEQQLPSLETSGKSNAR